MLAAEQHQHIAQFPPFLPLTLLRVAETEGADCERLCHGLGFAMADLYDPELRLSYRQMSTLAQRAEACLAPGLGLRVGQFNVLGSLGLVGYAMSLCPTLGDAIALAMQYQALAGSLLHVSTGESDANLWLSATLRFPGLSIQAFAVEELFASSLKFLRLLAGNDLQLAGLNCAYAPPDYAPDYQRIFACPITFGCLENRLIIDKKCLTLALPSHEPLALQQALSMLTAAAALPMHSHELALSVERAIAHRLREGVSIDDVASQLNLSTRTLRRRLHDAGLTFDSLLDHVRKTRALNLLEQATVRIDQVAAETGYRDARSFRRAFRRWTGVSPSERLS